MAKTQQKHVVCAPPQNHCYMWVIADWQIKLILARFTTLSLHPLFSNLVVLFAAVRRVVELIYLQMENHQSYYSFHSRGLLVVVNLLRSTQSIWRPTSRFHPAKSEERRI